MEDPHAFLSHGSIPTPQTGREDLVEAIGRLYDSVPGCEGIAVSMPGIIDTENGYVSMGGALRYNDGFYFRSALTKRCPVPVVLDNDAKCAAMAEAVDGALSGVRNGMVLLLGTMIGGALIKDHQLIRGSHYSAGEISFLITDRDGIPSRDGIFGNRCGVPALCAMYARAKGLPEEQVDGKNVFSAVGRRDPDALKCLERYAREIAVQIFNFQNLYDPDLIAIGGGISAQSALLPAIRGQLDRLYEDCPYPVTRAQITTCKYQNDANLYGAYRSYISFRPSA